MLFERPENILEARIRLDAEKQARGGAVRAFEGGRRPEPTPEQQAEAARQEAARALPDEQFDAHPDVVRLRERVACLERLQDGAAQARQWLEAQAQRIEARLVAGAQDVALALLLDALDDDGQLARARAALAERQADEAQLAGIRQAVELANRRELSAGSLGQLAADAREALFRRLTALKLAAVSADETATSA